MMHVLFISTGYPTDYYPLNGIFYRDQAEAVASAGHRTGMIAVNAVSLKHIFKARSIAGLGLSRFRLNDVETVLCSYPNIPKLHTYIVDMAMKKGRKLLDNYIAIHGVPALIHLHGFEGVLLAEYAKAEWNIPYVVTEHSSRFLLSGIHPSLEKYAAMCFRNSARNIAVSLAMAKRMEEKYNSPFVYVPNVVNTGIFSGAARSSAKPFVFLNVAALDGNKNQALLINAFADLIRNGADAELILAGDGPEYRSLRKLVEEKKLSGRVIFKGYLDRDALKQEYAAANAFVLCSTVETFGVVLIEAMSSGLPVISTKSFGPESIITDDRAGILCDNNPEELSSAMSRMMNTYERYSHEWIRNFAVENFSNFSVAKKLEAIYSKVLRI